MTPSRAKAIVEDDNNLITEEPKAILKMKVFDPATDDWNATFALKLLLLDYAQGSI